MPSVALTRLPTPVLAHVWSATHIQRRKHGTLESACCCCISHLAFIDITVLRIRPSDPDDASVPPRFRQVLLHPTSASDVRVDVDPATLAGTVGATSTSSVKKHPTFNFDHVLPENATQTELYDVATSGVIDDFMKGHNVTFLA